MVAVVDVSVEIIEVVVSGPPNVPVAAMVVSVVPSVVSALVPKQPNLYRYPFYNVQYHDQNLAQIMIYRNNYNYLLLLFSAFPFVQSIVATRICAAHGKSFIVVTYALI